MASMVWNSVTILALLCVNPINSATPIPTTAGLSEVPVAKCVSANGNPPAGIRWISNLRGNYATTQNKNANGTTTVTSLYKMVPTRSTDDQEVTCVISHPASQSTIPFTMELSILYPPEVTITHDNVNGGVSLKCVAKANPPARTYSWRSLPSDLIAHQPEGVASNKRSVFVKTGMNGNVSCFATNSIGTGNGTIEIIFKGSIEGHAIGKTIILSVAVGVLLLVVLATILIVFLIRRKRKAAAETYVNSSFQRQRMEQDSLELPGTYMGLNVGEQSLYSELHS
ncbi:nectin-1-like isoform X2 [Mustelus asterias]